MVDKLTPARKPMNQTALAAALGITRQAVSKLKRQGMPVNSLQAAQEWRAQNLNLVRTAAMATRSTDRAPLREALRRRMVADANMAEHRAREMAASLISVAAIQRQIREEYAAMAAAAVELVQRVAPRVSAMTDAREIQNLLESEIHDFLTREAAR